MNTRMKSVYFCCALALALPGVFWGQSCTITSPTASQVIQAAAPAGHQHIQHVDVPRGERARRAARRDRRLTEHAGADGDGQQRQPGGVQAAARVTEPLPFGAGERVQGVAVGAELPGTPGQCLGDARPERLLDHGKGLVAHPGTAVRRIIFCGSSHGSKPSAWQASRRVARPTPSNGLR